MLADALEHLVRGIVDNPDDVSVRDKQLRRGSILEVRVHPDDLGKVIGRGGRTATAFRTVISAIAGRGGPTSTSSTSTGVADRSRHVPPSAGTLPDVSDIEVCVGRIGKAHGVRGEVSVEVRTDEPERRFADGAVLRPPRPARRRCPRSLTVAGSRWHQDRLLVRFAEVPDRSAAEQPAVHCCTSTSPPDEVPDDPEEFYDHQLVGLTAEDTDGTRIGVVSEVLHHAGQDLLVLRRRRPRGRWCRS